MLTNWTGNWTHCGICSYCSCGIILVIDEVLPCLHWLQSHDMHNTYKYCFYFVIVPVNNDLQSCVQLVACLHALLTDIVPRRLEPNYWIQRLFGTLWICYFGRLWIIIFSWGCAPARRDCTERISFRASRLRAMNVCVRSPLCAHVASWHRLLLLCLLLASAGIILCIEECMHLTYTVVIFSLVVQKSTAQGKPYSSSCCIRERLHSCPMQNHAAPPETWDLLGDWM